MASAEDLEAILSATPTSADRAFSATLAPRIRALAERHLKHPVRVSIRASVGSRYATAR
jgi:superfamily II DNA/RNA helicase